MSTIGDELRTKATKICAPNSSIGPTAPSYFRDLADRIDAEMVELPKDADGMPIHVGDTVWGCISGMQMAVHELRLKHRWTISTDTGFIPKASAVTHVSPDSFERIADELEAWCDRTNVDGDACGVPRELARRIRRLAEREASNGTD